MADVEAVVAEVAVQEEVEVEVEVGVQVEVQVEVEEEVEVAAAFELPTRCLWERGIASTSDWS